MISEKEKVKAFWEGNPLMVGELTSTPGSQEFFEEHEKIYRGDIFPKVGIPDDFFPFMAGGKVLDVGCGPGMWTRELAKRGYRVSAVDLTEKAVEITKQSLKLFGLKANVEIGDAENLTFDSSTFDGVVSHGVIHHTPNTAKCVQEMSRVLKPGGIVFVSVYYKNLILRSQFLTKLISRLFSSLIKLPGRGREKLLNSGVASEIVRLYDGADNPIGKAYTYKEFEQMFLDAGLTVLRKNRFYFPKRAFGQFGFLIVPVHGFLSRYCGLLIGIVAQKN